MIVLNFNCLNGSWLSFQVFATLVYADSGSPVEKTGDDTEGPLLTSCDGLEFPTTDKPVTLLRGRASFKLKISQVVFQKA